MTAKYNQPSAVGTYVMSAAYFRSGAVAVKSRPNRFAATGRACLESVVCLARRGRPALRRATLIRRATRFSEQRMPCARNSAWTRGEP
jgi:hypothetical protein